MEDVTPTSDGRLYTVLAAFVVAALFFLVTPLWSTVHCLMTVIHELGHTLFGWLFGYPTIPALDLRYGGGVALHQGRSLVVLGGAHLLLFWLLLHLRSSERAFSVGCVLFVCYALVAHTEAHHVVILFMGHGFELLLATVFLYRALSGRSVVDGNERVAYGAVGLFIVVNDLWFAWSLIAEQAARDRYLLGKGGHAHDFHRIAVDYLGVDLSIVAAFFMVCCLLPPLVACAVDWCAAD